ncbi:NnrS family protein [Halopseudomonas pelagia]|uniref:NnrS family protein n=1 Tax=Halopseudomonas pelagia TaxID=553151 RepID=UPI00039EBD9A|nr:NnrS family protein [Halopseudomonas pelagia]
MRPHQPPRSALFELGFRPFFLAGSLFAAVLIPLWVAAWLGQVGDWQPTGGWFAWHMHEMLFGFVAAIIAGFLLTAVQNWTGVPGLSGTPLVALAAVWLLARLAWLAALPLWLVIALDMLFLPAVTVAMARSVWIARQKRNYPIVLVLALLALCNLVSLIGIASNDFALQRQGNLGALWLVAALVGMIGGRVIPFFTQRGLNLPQPAPALPWLDYLLLAGSILVALLMVSGIALHPSLPAGLLFALLGAGHLARLLLWHHPRLWTVPLLWSLHLAYAWLVVALYAMALWNAGWLVDFSQAVHLLAIGSISGMILAMIARVSLGHTGRPLEPAPAMSLAFILLNLAVPARVWIAPAWPQFGFWLAAVSWAGAFMLFVWYYVAILYRPRPDGRPG